MRCIAGFPQVTTSHWKMKWLTLDTRPLDWRSRIIVRYVGFDDAIPKFWALAQISEILQHVLSVSRLTDSDRS